MGALLALITGPAGRYLIGALILAALVGGSWHFGVISERNRQAAMTLETTRKQAIIDQQHRDQVAAATAQNQDLANRIEAESNAARTTIESLAEDNRKLAARTAGRLYDPNARACPTPDRVPKAGDTSSTIDPAAGAELSEKLSGLLLAEAKRADQAATWADTCYQWVSKLKQ